MKGKDLWRKKPEAGLAPVSAGSGPCSWLGWQNRHLQEIEGRPQCYPEVMEDLSH